MRVGKLAEMSFPCFFKDAGAFQPLYSILSILPRHVDYFLIPWYKVLAIKSL